MARKRIFAVSLEGARPAYVLGVYDNGILIISTVEERGAVDPRQWYADLLADMTAKGASGWVLMAEDRTSSFPAPATPYNLDATNEDGRTNIHTALDWYFTLQSRGALVIAPELQRYALRMGGMVDMVQADNDPVGRRRYRIDWTQFTCVHRAILLCVVGAVLEEPLSDRWIAEFCGTRKEYPGPPIWPVFRIMRGVYDRQHRDYEERVVALGAARGA